MSITTVGLTGFEHGFIGAGAQNGGGLFDAAPSAGVTASTTSPRNGSYCARIVAPAATVANLVNNFAGSPTKIVLRLGIKVAVRPTSGTPVILNLQGASGAAVTLRVSSGGQLQMSVGSGTSVAGTPIDTANWHLIELQLDSTAKTLDWKVDGVPMVRVSHTGTAMPPTSLLLGTAPTATGLPAFTADYDDVIVGTWTDAATDWYGDGKVLAQLPASSPGSATPTSLSPGDAGTAYTASTVLNAHQMVDDPPGTLGWTATRSTTDNLALRTATVGAYVQIAPAVTAEAGDANAVKAIMSYSSSTTTANLAACDVRNSAGAVSELWGLTGGVGKAYNIIANQFKSAIVIEPAAGWTAAEVNAIRFRFGGCTSADINPVPTVQAMMLEVDWYVAPPAPPASPLDETLIDDFDRADGPIYAGAGADIWTTLGHPNSGTTQSAALVVSNQLGLTDASAYARSLVELPDGSFDFLFDVVGGFTNSLTVYFGITGMNTAGWSGYYLVVQNSTSRWTVNYRLPGGGVTQLIDQVAPIPGSAYTVWIAKRDSDVKIYFRPYGGQFALAATCTVSAAAISPFVFQFLTGSRIDNVRGGPLVASGPATYPRTATDTWTVSSTASMDLGLFIRDVTDTWAVSDLATGVKGGAAALVRGATDTIVVSDAAVRASATRTRPVADNWTVTDVATRATATSTRTATDSWTRSDSANRAAGTRARGAVDAVAFVDVATRAVVRQLGAVDSLVISDSASAVLTEVPEGFPRTAADAVVISDVATRAIAVRVRAAVDSWNVSDSALRAARAFARLAADAVVLSDAAVRAPAGKARLVADAWVISDSAARSSALPGYALEVQADNPVGYWQMSDPDSIQLEKQGGAAMFLTGATPGVPGATATLGNAVSFDGVDDYGRVASLDLSSTDKITVEYWLKWDSYANNDDLSLEHGESNQAKGWAHDPNSSGGDSWATFTPNYTGTSFYEEQISRPSAATWHHIAVTVDRAASADLGAVMHIYVDGAEVPGNRTSAGQPTENFQNYPLYVMARSALGDGAKSLLGAGDMQHLAIYDYLLAPTRITAHYAARDSSGGTAILRPATDAWAVADSAGRAPVTRIRPTSDTWAVSDTAAGIKVGGVIRGAVDTVNWLDVAVRATATRARPASDSIIWSDAALRAAATRLRTALDTWSFSDSAVGVKVGGVLRGAADTVNWVDVAVRAVATRARPISDSITWSDAALRAVAAWVRVAVDAVTLSDVATGIKVGGVIRSAVDAVVIADSALRAPAARTRGATDSSVWSDIVARSAAQKARGATDAWSQSDNAVGIKVGGAVRTATDLWSVIDVSTRIPMFTRTAVDAIAIGSSAERIALKARPVADGWSISDTAAARIIAAVPARMTMIL